MSNVKATIMTAAAAALLFTGSALAATAFAAPVTGEAPYFEGVVATDQFTGQLQRSDVEAQAAAQRPASGEFIARAQVQSAASTLTRVQFEQSIDAMPAAGEVA